MWILTTQGGGGGSIVLLSGKKYSVGRKDCDIIVDDKSVSRFHCELLVVVTGVDNDGSGGKIDSVVKVTDKSRFGTFLRGKPLGQNHSNNLPVLQKLVVSEERICKEGDILQFGTNCNDLSCSFLLSRIPTVFCMSNMKPEAKNQVVNMIIKLGGSVSDDIGQCTHLVMHDLRVTLKVVLALVEGKPIISPNWLQALIAMNPGHLIPDTNKFLPPKSKGLVISNVDIFKVNPQRKHLFKGCTFIFLNQEQHNKAAAIVEAAQGNAVKFFSESLPPKLSGTVFCVLPTGKPDTLLELKITQLKEAGVRLIDENSIGIFVLNCTLSNEPTTSELLPPTETPTKIVPSVVQSDEPKQITVADDHSKQEISKPHTEQKRLREEESPATMPHSTERMSVEFQNLVSTTISNNSTVSNFKKFKKQHLVHKTTVVPLY